MKKLLLILLCVPLIGFGVCKNTENEITKEDDFLQFVDNKTFNSEKDKILCFFDAGCLRCLQVIRNLDSLSQINKYFPSVHIIFSDTEEEKIPKFLNGLSKDYSFQVMPFANYDTDEVDSYMEITFPDYDNPLVIVYENNKKVKLYEGTDKNEFNVIDLIKIIKDKNINHSSFLINNMEAKKSAYLDYKAFTGYDLSFGEFMKLIRENEDDLSLAYSLFVDGGYTKDLKSFKILLGIK